MDYHLTFSITLGLSAFLCSVNAGFLFAFAAVAMPGLKGLGDGEFIRAFQAIDGIIQNNQPLFIVVWGGSVVALVAATLVGLGHLDGLLRLLLVAAGAAYLLGVQLPTAIVNVPLNNKLQELAVGDTDEKAHREARLAFEARWNRWNVFRTAVACGVAAVLIGLLLTLEGAC